jgi:hypothetical protein
VIIQSWDSDKRQSADSLLLRDPEYRFEQLSSLRLPFLLKVLAEKSTTLENLIQYLLRKLRLNLATFEYINFVWSVLQQSVVQ